MLGNPLLLGDDGYQISRSVRMRSSASAFFNRTPASNGNRKTWTWSAWVKRGAFAEQQLTSAGLISGAFNYTQIFFDSSHRLVFAHYPDALSGWLTTTQVFRDPSAWYHIVAVFDSSNATSTDRMRLHVNGERITSFTTGAFSTTYPSLNADSFFNSTSFAAQIGRGVVGGGAAHFDGHLTEINFIDGQALTSAAFGETDAVTGVWKPRRYTGTYGTNGFFLNFSDPSAATAGAIGADRSGNGNNWTPNNISVTAGVTYDSMLDVPTPWADGGNGRGNYATLNPLFNTGALGFLPLSNANLTASELSGNAAWRTRFSTIAMTTGKYYAEFVVSYSGSSSMTAIGAVGFGLHDGGSATYVGQTATTYGYLSNSFKYNNAASASYGATFANGDIIGVAYDADAGTLTFFKNGASQGVAYSGIPSATYFFGVSAFWVSPDGVTTIDANFGQRPFTYTPPTGFRALNTQNLPEPLINRGNRWMDARLYTGNGTTQSVTGTAFAPDLVWLKARSSAISHGLFDTVRGAGKGIFSNVTNAEFDYGTTTSGELYQFTSDGFNLGSTGNFNANGVTNVAWQWRESAQAGFDIVTYTGTGVARTVAHSLGVAPKMIITKNRSASSGWLTYHSSVGAGAFLSLASTSGSTADTSIWQNTNPSSTVFSVGTAVSQNTNNYVAYLFADVPGFSRFGSYTGNGSADGPFVFCGFRPKFILLKEASGTNAASCSWQILDTTRNPNNVANTMLYPNLSGAESTGDNIDILSNGFKLRASGFFVNESGGTYIFAAFAENPFKYSLAR